MELCGKDGGLVIRDGADEVEALREDGCVRLGELVVCEVLDGVVVLLVDVIIGIVEITGRVVEGVVEGVEVEGVEVGIVLFGGVVGGVEG